MMKAIRIVYIYSCYNNTCVTDLIWRVVNIYTWYKHDITHSFSNVCGYAIWLHKMIFFWLWQMIPNRRSSGHLLITARVRSTTGGYVFTGVCLFKGVGYPGLWSQVPSQPLVPGPFWGATPISGPRSLLEGTPDLAGGHPRPKWGTPWPGLGYPPQWGLGCPPPRQGQVKPRAYRLLWFPAGGLSCLIVYLLFFVTH